MVKIEIKNAKVHDNGYGLFINYKSLDRIISTALGTRVDTTITDKEFSSNCCDVTVIIEPKPESSISIDIDGKVYKDLETLEEDTLEQFNAENEEKATEE
jgi:hypothetical protein